MRDRGLGGAGHGSGYVAEPQELSLSVFSRMHGHGDSPLLLSDSDEDGGDDGDCGPPCLSSDSDDEAELFTATDALRHWGVDVEAEEVPVLLLPQPICFLILQRDWKTIMMLTSWHERLRTCEGLTPWRGRPLFDLQWPPPDSQVWAAAFRHRQHLDVESQPEVNSDELLLIASQIRRWSGAVLQALEPGAREDEAAVMRRTVERLEGWASQVAEAEGIVTRRRSLEGRRWLHGSFKMFSALRFSSQLRGGANKLASALKQALMVVAPRFLVGALCSGLESIEKGKSLVVPSASTVSRNEIALDASLILLRREQYRKDMARWMWSDSSEVAGHDWFWTQFHELPQSELVKTFRAANDLALATRKYAAEAEARAAEDGPDAVVLEDAHDVALQGWAPMLRQLRQIQEHICAPAAMTSGQKGLAHKAGAFLHQVHLELPSDVPLTEFCTTLKSHTSDMGIEMSLPDFSVESLENILPVWINREAIRMDLEDGSSGVVGEALQQDGVSENAKSLMPNALPIYGLQHMTMNISKDVHTKLKYWPTFFKHLKNFGALLSGLQGDRRRRFIWTCLRGTAHQASKRLDKWSATLYEARWGEIVAFLKRFSKVLHLFRQGWDHEKYLRGVDNVDAPQGAQGSHDEPGPAPARTDAHGEFDPQAITAAIRCNLFNCYVAFILLADRVVERRLASWGEGCSCHEPLFALGGGDSSGSSDEGERSGDRRGMSEYRQRQLLELHYGRGVRRCPMAGKRADSMADGMSSQVLASAWAHIEKVMRAKYLRLHPLSPEQLELLQSEMRLAQSAQEALLRTKNDYWERLPWSLAAVAQVDEDRAREKARLCVLAFERDPRPPPVHHPRTWFLMAPGAPFRVELDEFIAGAPRWSLSDSFLEVLAEMKLMPCVETTIEEKHARVTQAKARHHIGPVRVSMSNRFPMLERRLLSQPEHLSDLLRMFEGARTLAKLPARLDLQDHPLLQNWKPGKGHSFLVPLLTAMVYHSDLDTCFFSLRRPIKADMKVKEKRAKDEAALGERRQQFRGETLVERNAIRDHFKQTHLVDYFYSIPKSAAPTIEGLESFYNEAASVAAKRRRVHEGSPPDPIRALTRGGHPEGAAMDDDALWNAVFPAGAADAVGEAGEAEASSSLVVFQVGLANLGRKKTVKVAPGAGQRLLKTDMAISVYMIEPCSTLEAPTVFTQGAGVGKPVLCVLGDLGEPDQLQTELKGWSPQGGLRYTFKGVLQDDQDGVTEPLCTEVVTSMFYGAAFPDSPPSKHIAVSDRWRETVYSLEAAGLVKLTFHRGVETFAFTEEGFGDDALTCQWQLSQPEPALAVREGVPLAERTSWELLRLMKDAGWRWLPWVAPSQRRRSVWLPEGYTPGDPMLFFSSPSTTIVICQSYLVALLRAEELCTDIAHIPHGRTATVYEDLLDGGALPDPLPLRGDAIRGDLDEGPRPRGPRPGRGVTYPCLTRGGTEPVPVCDGGDGPPPLPEHEVEMWERELELALCAAPPSPPLPPPAPAAAPPPGDEPETEVPAPAPAPLADEAAPEPRVVVNPALAWVAHPAYHVDIRHDGGLAHFKHDTVRGILAMHCGHPRHAKTCRVNRTLTARDAKPAQGRPAGFLLAWAACAGDYDDASPAKAAQAHQAIANPPQNAVEPKLDFAHRQEAQQHHITIKQNN